MTTLLLAKTATTQDLLKGHKEHNVGSHNFIQLTVEEFLTIPPIPTNRDSVRRVPKMRNTFIKAYAENQENTLTEVAIGIVSETFQDQDSQHKYMLGDWFVVDGNTRQHFWRQYSDYADRLPKGVTAKIHYLKSMKDVEFAYYPYNNAKSSEKASEILQGLARRYNWSSPRQTMFQNGGYKTALDWAALVPGEPAADTFKAFHDMFETLKLIDGIPSQSKYGITQPALDCIKSQSIIAACLRVLKQNPGNLKLHDFISRLSTITHDDLDTALLRKEGFDAVEIIALEYAGQSHRRNNTRNAEPWLKGQAKSTKHASREIQMDFLVHWITVYMTTPKLKYKLLKEEMWQGAWYNSFPLGDDDNE
jgi:hypothetical protein